MGVALAIRAWLELLRFDVINLRGFAAVQRAVKRHRPLATTDDPNAVRAVLGAVNRACAWYYKTPMCLQYAVAVTCLLRRRGVPAELVVGCRLLPFAAHAWVELDRTPVGDPGDDLTRYRVLDRW